MYQGAAQARIPASDREDNPRKRRRRTRRTKRRRRRRNPGPTTWILLAGGTAVAVGVGIAYAVHRKRKKAGALPAGGSDVIPPAPKGGKKKPSGGGAAAAPAFPYSTDEAKTLETTWAIAYVAENCDPTVGSLSKGVNAITDDIFYEMYKIKKIPSGYGSSWQPYVDSWLRARAVVREQAKAAGC